MAHVRLYSGKISTFEEDPDLRRAFETLTYRTAPAWLGPFGMRQFGSAWSRPKPHCSPEIEREARKLAALVPGQEFNACFVQRYAAGQCVLPHRDPRNNRGHTVIGIYGEFSPVLSQIGTHRLELPAGDVLVMPCTIGGQQGPVHSMTWKPGAWGVRFIIAINTIHRS